MTDNPAWEREYASSTGNSRLTVHIWDHCSEDVEQVRFRPTYNLWIKGKAQHPLDPNRGAVALELYLHPYPYADMAVGPQMRLPEELVRQVKSDVNAAINELELAKRAEWSKKETRTVYAFVGSSAGFAGENIVRRQTLRDVLRERGHQMVEDTHYTRATLARGEADAVERIVSDRMEAWRNSLQKGMNAGNTQLWEPCERCGAEPSYMTPHGHLCKDCR